MERKKSEKEREIEAIFTNFMDWGKRILWKIAKKIHILELSQL